MNALEFLTAELDHAQRHLARTRRLQAKLQSDLEAAGLDEVKVYEHLAISKAYRQLQRDELFYQQMWLRIQRALDRHQPKPASPLTAIDAEIARLAHEQQQRQAARPQPIRHTTPQPGRNSLCPCGSNLKFKRCCANPNSAKPATAA